MVILGSICGLKNVSQIQQWVTSDRVSEFLKEKFGINHVPCYANDLNSFCAVADIAVSHVFYAWVFGFGGKVRIKSPTDVREGYAKMVREAAERL